MLTDEGMSLKYMIISFSLLTSIAHAFLLRNLSLDTLAVTKIYTKILKVKIRFSPILIIQKKNFIITSSTRNQAIIIEGKLKIYITNKIKFQNNNVS